MFFSPKAQAPPQKKPIFNLKPPLAIIYQAMADAPDFLDRGTFVDYEGWSFWAFFSAASSKDLSFIIYGLGYRVQRKDFTTTTLCYTCENSSSEL